MNAILALEDGTWYRGVAAGAQGEAVWRGRLQHGHDRLPGSAHGSVLRRADRHDDRAANRQLRRCVRRCRVAGDHVWPALSCGRRRRWRVTGARTARFATISIHYKIVAIADVDTRALTRVLRSAGVMRGVIATGHADPDRLVEKARAIPRMEGSDLVSGVTCDRSFEWRERVPASGDADHTAFSQPPSRRARQGDCGSRRTTLASSGTSCGVLMPMVATCTFFRRPRRRSICSPSEPDGDLSQQRSGRSRGTRVCHRQRPRARQDGRADVRYLPRSSGARSRRRCGRRSS